MEILLLFAFCFSILSSAFPSPARLAELAPRLDSLKISVKDDDSALSNFLHGRALADPEDLRALSSFDPARQLISTTGIHRFIAPGPKDLRGPCPGLNALANHGYIARDGLTNLVEATDAAVKVFGFAVDLALVISLTGVLISGNPLTMEWSIGGPPPTSGLLGPIGDLIFGRPSGLSNSHNKYETDGSAMKGDALLFNGDADSLRLEYFKGFLDLKKSPEDDYSSHDLWMQHRVNRFEHSISNNPLFWWGPFAGLIVGEAGIWFPPEVFKNHSHERPDGVLTKETLFNFYSVREDPRTGELVYTKGHERFPDKWYRQPTDRLSAARFLLLIVKLLHFYPRAGNIGGNTGRVDTFTPLDLGDLTGGVLNSLELLDPQKLSCFILRLVESITPDILKKVAMLVGNGILQQLIDGIFGVGTFGCPIITIDQKLLKQFPGAK